MMRHHFIFASLAAVSSLYAQGNHAEVERIVDPFESSNEGTAVSPLISTRGIYTSYQVNVNTAQQNLIGDAANEPSIAIDPNDPTKIVIGWRQFDTITSSFRQAGVAYSTNGGQTWTKLTPLNAGVARSDPVLMSDGQGKIYYLSLNATTFRCDLFTSIDGGITWTGPTPATGGDKAWMAVDGSKIYQTWSNSQNSYNSPHRQFNRSFDGGQTWGAPIAIPHEPNYGTIEIGPNGEVYLGTSDGFRFFYCLRSSNAQNPAVTPTWDVDSTFLLGGDLDIFPDVNPQGLLGQVSIAVDRSNGPYRGRVYVGCSVKVNAFNDPGDFNMVYSADGGSTFSSPKRIHKDPSLKQKFHYFGNLSCAPNGRLDAVWLDTREASFGKKSNLYWSYSVDGGETWSADTPLSAAFWPDAGYPVQQKIGDYLGAVSQDDAVHIAYPATYNNEQDIYYVRVPAPVITIQGAVELQNFVPSLVGEVIEVSLRQSGTPVWTGTTTVQSGNTFLIAIPQNLIHQTYDIGIKGRTWLRRVVPGIALGFGGATLASVSLTNGDCDGDNFVTTDDYLILSNSFDLSVEDPGYDVRGDLDGNEVVSTDDYLILNWSFDTEGES